MVHNSAEGIVARPVRQQGPRHQIARYGTAQPGWSPKVYITPDRERMSVEIDVKKEVVKRIEACRAHGYNRAGVRRVSI